MTLQRPSRSSLSRLIGIGALFSGGALLTHIVAGVSLILGLVVAALLLGLGLGSLWMRAFFHQRQWIKRRTKVGLFAGILAVIAYDSSKFALSQLEPSPYNPFEVIRVFGRLLAGSAATEAVVVTLGTAFHVLNGVSFGVGFCFLFKRPGILAGIAWGLFLELFQLALYPGWLDIGFYSEFLEISALSHIVYGAVLGRSCQYGLAQLGLGDRNR